MVKHIRAGLLLAGLTLILGSVLYPLALWAVGQTLFSTQAAGSLIAGPDGQPAGSRLLAQEFKGDGWFHPRPSAVDYNAAASGGSNLAASNPKLRERVEESLKSQPAGPVPADAVTASGSGLDPYITLRNAERQVGRVSQARGLPAEELRTLLAKFVGTPWGGEPLVNVTEVNAELARQR